MKIAVFRVRIIYDLKKDISQEHIASIFSSKDRGDVINLSTQCQILYGPLPEHELQYRRHTLFRLYSYSVFRKVEAI
jgi:hypothetical protein